MRLGTEFAQTIMQALAGVNTMVARKVLPGIADVAEAVECASFDVVLMVEVLHEIAPARRPGVVASCARALVPGGWLEIVDETYPSTLEQARQPEYRFPIQTGLDGPIERSLFGEGFTLLAVQRRG